MNCWSCWREFRYIFPSKLLTGRCAHSHISSHTKLGSLMACYHQELSNGGLLYRCISLCRDRDRERVNGNQSDGGRQGTGAPNRGEGAGRFHITSYRLLDISLFDKHTKHSSISTRRSQTVCPIHPICFYFHKENSSLFLLQGQKEENNQRILSNVESNICNNMKYDFFFFFFCFFFFFFFFFF